jgi:thymidylate synthase
MQQITLQDPSRQKEITVPGRRVSLPAQIAETMWILAGRNDVGWLSHYLPRAAEFSDDGQTWRGGYGPRLRDWHSKYDQLDHIVKLLKQDPETRRAVFTIYDPAIDSAPGKDIPCNNWVHFLPRGRTLNAHVAIRSNDLFWGWSGINAFEWTSLLQVVAGLTGMESGSITFSISSLHLYERHWAKAQEIVEGVQLQGIGGAKTLPYAPTFQFKGTLEEFDELVRQWFEIEGQIRKGGLSDAVLYQVTSFPEPMLRSWLAVLLAWHHDDQGFLSAYEGTALAVASALSPKKKRLNLVPNPTPVKKPSQARIQFTVFATKLHAEKNAAYGDSWKKRGEMLGIMANIARKVDRLGVPGGGDTAADTAIDLAVYLIKYNLWLRQQAGAQDAPTEGKSHVAAVDYLLQHLEKTAPEHDGVSTDVLIESIRARFDHLEHLVEEKRASRGDYVRDELITLAYPLAVRLWWAESQKEGQAIEAWQAGNAGRFFDGYNIGSEAK